MTIISAIQGGSGDAYAMLVEALRREFGEADVSALAERIFEAERVDFHWQGRVQERYLGQHFPVDGGDEECFGELARVAILSFVAARWHAGVCLVDGEGSASELLWLRSFERLEDAKDMFSRAR
jgi:hypothetical protein